MKIRDALFTIGHSTRTIEEFINILKSYEIEQIVDIRTIPRSRHVPQFNRDTLQKSLRAADIEYVHIPGLGGLRHPNKDSPNMGWHNSSFRGFADYMQTKEFGGNLKTVIEVSQNKRIALMCAEAVPWRCHRSLIADALNARKIRVEHILSMTSHHPHTLTPFAKVDGPNITYPPGS